MTALAGPELGAVYRLRLPFVAPPLTTNEARGPKAHWSDQRAAKQQVALAVVVAVRQARVPKIERCAVTLIWYAPDYGTRDADSLGLMMKACLDALTPPKPAILAGTPTRAGTPRKTTLHAKLGAGIIRDDNAEVVGRVAQEIHLGQPDPRIELEIVPLPPLPPRPKTTKRPRPLTARGR